MNWVHRRGGNGLGLILILLFATTGRAPHGARPVQAQSSPDQAYSLVATWSSSTSTLPAEAFENPRGLAIDPFDGQVFVVDSGNRRVQVFQADGTYVRTIGMPDGSYSGLIDPADVAISGSRLYVTDVGADSVVLFDVEGEYRASWDGLEGPWGIATWVDGRVFVAENRASRVAVFKADGTREATWGRFGGGDDLNRPEGLALDSSGRLLVANTGNQRIVRFSSNGLVTDSTGDIGASPRTVAIGQRDELYIVTDDDLVRQHGLGISLPQRGPTRDLIGGGGLAVGADGRLFGSFADDERPLHGVRIWSGTTVVDEWGDVPVPLGRLDRPQRVWADATGVVTETLVVDRWRRAQAFDAGGRAIRQVPIAVSNDVAMVDGGDLLAVADGRVSRLDRQGTAIWTLDLPEIPTEAPWAVAAAVSSDGSQLQVLDVGRQRLHLVSVEDGTIQDAQGFRPAPGASTALWDLAPKDDDSTWFVNRSAATLERRELGRLRVLDSWNVPGDPLRVAVGPEGNVFVLNRHGWVWKYAPNGQLRAVWPASDSSTELSSPADLAIDGAGRVLVVDPGLDIVRVFNVDPDATPGDVPSFDPSCTARGDKLAAPERIVLGEHVRVTLAIDGTCPRVRNEADIVLVIDVSGSMIGDKMDAAREAANAFVQAIDFIDMRVALIAFNQAAVLEQPLTANPINVRNAVERLVAGGGTDIAVALDDARQELTGPRRRNHANSVVILLTDGGSAAPPAVRAAELAKLEGARIFTVGFGAGANGILLEELASAPTDYAFAPDEEQLIAIYRSIAERIAAEVLFTSLVVVDEVPADMRYVLDSAVPLASFDNNVLTWRLGSVPMSGTSLFYDLEPLQTGIRPTNVFAVGEGVDGLGRPGQVTFPVPIVEVIAPMATLPPPPGATPSATPTVTSSPPATAEPRRVYLPIARNDHCPKRRARADVVLVIDTSTSMRELTRTGRSKLAAARDAAAGFVALLEFVPGDLDNTDRAAVVGFNFTAEIAANLGDRPEPLHAALQRLSSSPGTRIDLGLDYARGLLMLREAAPDRTAAVILLTDGHPTGTSPEQVRASAASLKDIDQESPPLIYAIGLGTDIDIALLGDIATDHSKRILAPDAEDLQRIYREIARELPCIGREFSTP